MRQLEADSQKYPPSAPLRPCALALISSALLKPADHALLGFLTDHRSSKLRPYLESRSRERVRLFDKL